MNIYHKIFYKNDIIGQQEYQSFEWWALLQGDELDQPHLKSSFHDPPYSA